jgi:hypothetical protein
MDKRDKVYSQLGLGQATVPVDYALTVTGVYITSAKYILRHSDSLLILTCVEDERCEAENSLPSCECVVELHVGQSLTSYLVLR